MIISDEVINDIRNSASITEVIGHYIPLIKKGKGYTALCPFHDDHDPSLSISEDKQIYKCFVCNNGGNVFTFVMNFKKCSFIEAVVEVAKIIGKPLDIEIEKKPKAVSKYQRYYDLLEDTVKFSNYMLSTFAGEEANRYLESRGISKEIIEKFMIGYNPPKDALSQYLKSKGYKDNEMETVNVARVTNYGMKDVFADHIMFPIHDMNGNPIAFSARTMRDSEAKYINTASTLIYNKGDTVYNYHRAKEDGHKANRIIITEGVMDTIAFARADIPYVVSTLGTACTQKQLEIIATISRHMVFCYDGDKAGQNATMKAVELALNMGYEPSVIKNETGLDPDEIISNGKPKDLQNFASVEITGIEFAFEFYKKIYPLNNYSNRKEYHKRISELIEKLKDNYDKENYYHDLYNLTGLVRNNSLQIKKTEYNEVPIVKKESKTLEGIVKAEYTILSQMIMSKKAVEIYRRELGCLFDENCEEIAMMIINEYRHNNECSYAKLFDDTKDEKIKGILIDIASMETLSSQYDEEVFKGAISRVRFELSKNRIDDLKKKISNCDRTNQDKLNEYLKEYSKLIKELGGSYGKNS